MIKEKVKKLVKPIVKPAYDAIKEEKKKKERTSRNQAVLNHASELLANAGDCKTIEILEHEDCCGCHACESACPFDAITMEPDKEGFLFPVVNQEKCKNCGLCQKACPALHVEYKNEKDPVCYAVMAQDEVRDVSASGGMFSLAANPILEDGGVVCGAAYGEDFRVEHIVIESKEEMYKLRGSKYVQSANHKIYKEVKEYLAQGRKVLYSGCPCQIAGLYTYLQDNPENLFTVDLICHGVPSPKTFDKYIRECYADKEIEEISFRDKKVYGWSTEMNVYFKDGTEHHERCSKDPYYRAFLPCLGMRPSCTVCKYTTLPRQADISIGDFWGIGNYRPDLRDAKGTSLVLVNSEKGRQLFERAKSAMKKVDVMPITTARPRNYTIDHPFRAHTQRKRFMRLLDQYPFEKAVQYALTEHYDVGIMGLWYGRNYGSILTYYALNRVLEQMGLSVLMIDNALPGDPKARSQKTHPYQFARQYYKISGHRDLAHLKELNNVCDTFIVGSDQLWNYGLSKPYGQAYFLGFVDENHKKISYASSFGKTAYAGTEGDRIQTAQNLKRMDAVSVREPFSAEICKNTFGVEAKQVLDPVFLCPMEEYERLIEDSGLHIEEPYLFAYILDSTPQKGEMLREIAERTGKKVYLVLDESPRLKEKNRKEIALKPDWNVELLEEVDAREWLCYMKHADGIVTDSFHGTCFSILFQRPFHSIVNAKRGAERFRTILGTAGLMDHLYENPKKLLAEPELFGAIDYKEVSAALQPLVEESRQWLNQAITEPKLVQSYATYPTMDQRLDQRNETAFLR